MSTASLPAPPSLSPPPSLPLSWADDLRHPLSLMAILLLVINDHLLKGRGLLPGWLTGKLSDIAGLFFFPLLLAALARGSLRLLTGRDLKDRRPLAAFVTLATGTAFTAIKLFPPINAWVAGVWGVMQMDATDLWTLPMLPLSAAFLLRETTAREPHPALPTTARRCLDFAAVLAAGLASAATSQRPPPPPPQPVVVASEPEAPAAQTEACASLALTVCERSRTTTFVVVEATSISQGSCDLAVTQALAISGGGAADTRAELLPARLRLKEGETATFSLSFLTPTAPEPLPGSVGLTLDVQQAPRSGEPISETLELSRPCRER